LLAYSNMRDVQFPCGVGEAQQSTCSLKGQQ